MQHNRENMQQQQQQQQQGDNYPNMQYYEIAPGSDNNLHHHHQYPGGPTTEMSVNGRPVTAHLHPIVINQQQLQDILPGAVFGDPHLHYHIIPSRRALESVSPQPQSCSRLEQIQHQHYNRQLAASRCRPPPTRLDELAKERADRQSLNFESLARYGQLGGNAKSNDKSGLSMIELSADSQSVSTKNKCQCHSLQEQQQQQQQQQATLRLKRDSDVSESDLGGGGMSRQPPALPPRPPPRPSSRRYELPSASTAEQCHMGSGENGSGGCCKKYVVLCCLCGGLSAAVGSLFLAVHAVLSAHTASLALFETVPSYIPGTMLIFMGLFTMLLARRKHRYGFLMKVCGSVSIVCALVCVLVTVTTTVVHMSRLQGLRECVYTARAKSCTCYGAPQSRASDPGVLFEGTPHCEAVHGALYACLRALFGVSVAGILACIFSCMLVYQLLSHEKKKMYWEQLELRCRSLYGQGAGGAAGLVSARPAGTCGCCNDCGGIGPWWAQSPGNLYTPNPDMAPARRWRLPWSRSRGAAPVNAGDTSYGFHHNSSGNANGGNNPDGLMDATAVLPYGILGAHSAAGAYSVLQPPHDDVYGQAGGASPYSVLEAAGVPLWGPPPPYSDPNSPARRPQAYPARTGRIAKRIESLPLREVEYSRGSEIKRPNDNYENSEAVSNNDTTDAETSEARTTRSSKHKKAVKGVDNAGFQPSQEPSGPKQSESELYFGDVSSCCGPESSLYDFATDREARPEPSQPEAGTSNYPQFQKRPSSKRSRRQHRQQPTSPPPPEIADVQSSCSSNNDEPNPSSSYNPHQAELEYEVIRQQRHYNNYEEHEEEEEGSTVENRDESPCDEAAYGAADGSEDAEEADKERDFRDYRQHEDEDVRPVNV